MGLQWIKYVAAGIGLGLAVRTIHEQKSATPVPASEEAPASPQELRMAQGK